MAIATKIAMVKRVSGFLMAGDGTEGSDRNIPVPELLGQLMGQLSSHPELKSIDGAYKKYLVTLSIEPLE